MQSQTEPLTAARCSIAFTLPETEEKTGLEIKEDASAIFIPFKTLSPALTSGFAGAPICWLIGKTIISAAGIFTISLFSEKLFPSKGCTPDLKETFFIKFCTPLLNYHTTIRRDFQQTKESVCKINKKHPS